MSKFGHNSFNLPSFQMSENHRFSYNPFQHEVVFQHRNHWDVVRNNIDNIIQSSKVLQKNEERILSEEDLKDKESDTSKCNALEVIYDCPDEETLKTNPTAVLEEEKPTPPTPIVEVDTPKKKRFDFASVVFKYRNELARRKHKEILSLEEEKADAVEEKEN